MRSLSQALHLRPFGHKATLKRPSYFSNMSTLTEFFQPLSAAPEAIVVLLHPVVGCLDRPVLDLVTLPHGDGNVLLVVPSNSKIHQICCWRTQAFLDRFLLVRQPDVFEALFWFFNKQQTIRERTRQFGMVLENRLVRLQVE